MIEILTADITRLALDVVVNAADPHLLGGDGVDGAIHRAAGPRLLDACRALGGCPHGDARITPAFDLPARWIVHAVGPLWRGGAHGEARLLEACYRASFRLAAAEAARSIVFPAISTGAYGYPKQAAAAIALRVMREHDRDFDRIVCCCYSELDRTVYEGCARSS